MKWINAMRPSCGILTALLVISGFFYAHLRIDWIVVVTVFFITSMAMLINDYYDRDIDVAKGRLLASSQPVWFLRYALTIIVASFGLSIIVWLRNPYFGMLCMGMWFTSIVYNKVQRNPLAKNMIVSMNVGATILFPSLIGNNVFELCLLATCITCIVSVREFMKDVEDIEVDRGKKRTLALVMNSRLKRNSAILWKHLMSLLLLVLIVRCLIKY
jgi:4-hydroxybenzoate polyprenyltransferase